LIRSDRRAYVTPQSERAACYLDGLRHQGRTVQRIAVIMIAGMVCIREISTPVRMHVVSAGHGARRAVGLCRGDILWVAGRWCWRSVLVIRPRVGGRRSLCGSISDVHVTARHPESRCVLGVCMRCAVVGVWRVARAMRMHVIRSRLSGCHAVDFHRGHILRI
jgi:hypothetical protein